jgi:hypothetical protein
MLQLDGGTLTVGIRNLVEQIEIDGTMVTALDVRLYVGAFHPWEQARCDEDIVNAGPIIRVTG